MDNIDENSKKSYKLEKSRKKYKKKKYLYDLEAIKRQRKVVSKIKKK